jgi:hypothetical protein
LETLLAEAGTTIPLQAGEQSGAYGDAYSWRLTIEPYGETTEAARRPVEAY